MSIKTWISAGNFEQFENCKTEQQLFNALEEELNLLKERLGDIIFVDKNGEIVQADIQAILSTPSIELVDDDLEIVGEIVCEKCSHVTSEPGICPECGHINKWRSY
jgi:hypothetical protein